MEKVKLSLSIEDEKLEAMEIFLKKAGSSAQKKMEEALKNLYEEVVPEPVREFVDAKAGGKPKRPTPPPKPKPDPKPKVEPRKETATHELP
jgi:hypothetical protein